MVKTVEFREIVPKNFEYSPETDDSYCGDEEQRRSMGSVSKTVISARGASPDDEQNGTKNGISNGSEWAKCIFLFFFLFIAGMSNWAVLAYTHDYVPRESLPDIVFSLVSEQRWASSLGDFCVALCIVMLGALLVIHQHRGTILKRVVFCAGTLYAMRSVTLAATQLPSGYTDNQGRCRDQVESEAGVFFGRLFEQTIRIGFQSKDQMLCGDLLFSGHTLVMVTCSLAVAYYLPKSIKPLQWVSHVACLIGMICMTISRTHYTIDVVIAYWLSNMVFRMYHAYCEVDMCMERRKSILYSWWPCRIVDWLEQDIVPGRLENRCQLPWRRSTPRGQERGGASAESSDSSVTMCDNITTSHHQKHVSISSSSTYPLPC
ncbi:Sphingomyelin synthase-like domain-containing protein [Caenorhabditis elegans]|uniref:Sphingomyelin synthase-like domain-containing protein n=1 Tax=Caenorhabditis elegans TaxID=6239 RepID=A0A1C3NSJ8_CAEEL|nr:Sphingomyelin synthase-like domain-containing protein [Caenorhabditis elegans]SBV53374.1 Sphingomyelin synthase-like domain-containing protein [Caenorhabditis elegans]|eukprot:NP_001317881.1 Putative phosphatidylcholine:ceramide cholinephosphotransferase 3 [Caenorhabditis elegans]